MSLVLSIICFIAFGYWLYVAIEPEAVDRVSMRLGFLALAIFMLTHSVEELVKYLGQ